MAERYSQLFTLPANLYSEGSPVLIEAGALLHDNVTGGVLAQLKIKSLSNKAIKALTVGIIPYDVAERQLSDAVMHQYLDLSLGRDSEFGQRNAIALPDPATRSFKVYVSELVFDDNSIYSFPKNEWVSLDIAKVPVSQILNDDVQLIKQFHATYGAQYEYLPKRERCLWLCSCGSINHDDEANCHNCGQEYTPFEKVDIPALKTARDERVAEERRQANEATRLVAKRRKKISIIASAVLLAAFLVYATGWYLIPYIKYTNAIKFLEAKSYDKAYEAFIALGNFSDSEDKAKDAIYQKGNSLLNSGAYTEAAVLYKELEDYKDSADLYKEAKYEYVLANKNDDDLTTYKYLEELKEANYKDSYEIYDSLYKWSVKLVALNTTEKDYETILSSVSRKATYLHYLFVVQGGAPEQLLNITHKIYWPDGDVTDATWYWEKAGRGSYLDAYFDNNNGFYTGTATGTMKIKVYNQKTGDFLGEASIKITK